MSRPVGAHLEGELLERYEEAEERSPEENKSAFLRSLIVDGLDAKDRDVLDAIDASDELREAVEARREEGEPLDDAARRLLREGVNQSTDEPQTTADRAVNALAVAIVTGVVAVAYAFAGGAGAVVAILAWCAIVAFDDVFLRVVARFAELADAADRVRDELEDAAEEHPDAEERDREVATEEEPA